MRVCVGCVNRRTRLHVILWPCLHCCCLVFVVRACVHVCVYVRELQAVISEAFSVREGIQVAALLQQCLAGEFGDNGDAGPFAQGGSSSPHKTARKSQVRASARVRACVVSRTTVARRVARTARPGMRLMSPDVCMRVWLCVLVYQAVCVVTDIYIF